MTSIAPGAFALLLASFGGIGLPLGVPPEPENPAMAYVAPDECLFYATWSARAEADPQSANHTEQLLAEEEVQRFLVTLERAVSLAFNRPDQARNDPRANQLNQLVPLLVRRLTNSSTAVFIDRLEVSEEGMLFGGGALVEAGDDSAKIVELLAKLLSSGDRPSEPIRLGRITGYRFPAMVGSGQQEVAVASGGAYLLIGLGEKSLDEMVRRIAAKKIPAWFSQIGERLPVERRASLSYVNTPVLVDKLMPLLGPSGEKMADSIGIKQVGELIGVVGLDDQGLVSRSLLKLRGEPAGFLKPLDGKGLQAADLEFLPRDAMFAAAVTLDSREAYDLVKRSMEESEENADFFAEFSANFERQFKLRLREDVLESLGDVWTLSASSVDGWTGATLTVEVTDPQTITTFADAFARQVTHQQVEVIKYEGFEIHTVVGRNDFLRPAWCVTQNRLIMGLSAQAVKGAVVLNQEERGLFKEPRLADALAGDGKVISVSYQDTAKIFESSYSYLPLLLRAMSSGARDPYRAAAFDPVTWVSHYLPSARSIHRHLQPSLSVTRLKDDGIETESHSTIPTLNLGASAPLAVAALVPAVQSARRASQRVESANNLKQIGLALHNHHDTYQQFPPAYLFTDDKQPGLSWRVKILPFIEQQELYNQFQLNEPWDSEHNKALIAKMPKIYRSPSSKAEAGKTVYLGISGKDGIFAPPNPPEGNMPLRGVSMASVVDGTSNTIAVVEASDDIAVIWTKPDDYTPDPQNPSKGLLGLYPEGFQALITDGSIRFISDKVDARILQAAFGRSDGMPGGF